MSKPLQVGIVLAILALAGWRLFAWYGAAPPPGAPVASLLPAACTVCDQAYATRLGAEPAECVKCGEQALWRARHCKNSACNLVFPWVRDLDAPAAGAAVICPACGGERSGEVPANAIDVP